MATQRWFTMDEVLREFEGVISEASRQFCLGNEVAQLSLKEDMETRLETLPNAGNRRKDVHAEDHEG